MNNPCVPPDADQRRAAIRALLAEFSPITMGLQGGGHESGVLFSDAIRAYLAGTFAAALVCGHASCERELAGWVNWLGTAAPKGWDRWGLGQLTKFAVDAGGLPTQVAAVLFEVSEKRRVLSHFKDPAGPSSQVTRAMGQLAVFDPDDFQSAFDSALAEDALLAIRACLMIRATDLDRVPAHSSHYRG